MAGGSASAPGGRAGTSRSEDSLHTERITTSATPRRWLCVLHGIYGAGRNWRSVASRLAERRPDWGILLVDLRLHGDSPAMDPPHTVAACAEDVLALAGAGEPDMGSILGHSFGGKVALEVMRRWADRGERGEPGGGAPEGPRQAWIVDSPPGVGEPEGSAAEMLSIVRRNPGPFDSRSEGEKALAAEGVAAPVARWMTTNLSRDDAGRYRWTLDWDAMEELLESFFETDAWPVVEEPPEGWEVHLIRATGSPALGRKDVARAEEAARAREAVWYHEIAGGHWLNADNPDAVVELLSVELPA